MRARSSVFAYASMIREPHALLYQITCETILISSDGLAYRNNCAQVKNPATDEVIALVPECTKQEMQAAVDNAKVGSARGPVCNALMRG